MPEQGLTIFKNGSITLPKMWDSVQLPKERLSDGVGAGFGRVTYKGSKWGYKYQGQNYPISYTMPDGSKIPSPYLDIVILRTTTHSAKAWYEGVYVEGQTGAPQCWSTNSVVPDQAAPHKQSKTCVACPHNKWGSKINRDTGQATRGKACMDMKRMAVVPVNDIENRGMGGPVMLSVPPTSLKRLAPYEFMLEQVGLNYCQVWTRISFLPGVAYPVFDFDARGVLNEAQAAQVIQMLEHPLVERILDTEVNQTEAWDESAEEVHRTAPTATYQPVTPSASVPHESNRDDGMAIPEHLRRAPAAPTAPPAEPAPAPQPEPEPAPAASAGPATDVPPGVDPAEWAEFLAMKRGGGAPKGRRGRPPAEKGQRNPPVSPQPTDSAAVVAAQAAAHPVMDAPAGVPGPAATTPNPVATQGQVIDTLMSTIAKHV